MTVTEKVCTMAWSGGVCNGVTLANFSLISSGQGVLTTRMFTQPFSGEVYILKDISYDGATTSSLLNSHVLGTVPEPMTLSLMGAGLLGLGLLKRRGRK